MRMSSSSLVCIFIFNAFFGVLLLTQKCYADQLITSQGATYARRSREPKYKIEFHPEDSPYIPDNDQESVFMPDENGNNHVCFLPKVEKPRSGKPLSQHNTSNMIMESDRRMEVKTPEELLAFLDEICLYKAEGWWTYEFCYKKRLRQLHLEDDKVVQEFVLGVYDPEATYAYNQNLSDISILKDPRSKDASQRYHAQQYTNGTICDLTNQPRETEARFVCSEGKATFSSITELATCKYAITIQSPLLCKHPLFQQEQPVWHTIHCNLVRKDAETTKAEEDDEHDKEIKLVTGIEFPYNVDADGSPV